MISRRYPTVVAMAITFAWSLSAWGQGAPSPEQQLLSADVVALARCESVTTHWRGGKVFSLASYRILDGIKGDAGATVQISVPGGTAMHPVLQVPVTTKVSHGFSVREGEEAVLYLRRHANRSGAGRHQLIAKDAVIADANGARRIHTSVRVTRTQSRPAERAGGPPTVLIKHQPPTVTEFVAWLKSEAESEASQRN